MTQHIEDHGYRASTVRELLEATSEERSTIHFVGPDKSGNATRRRFIFRGQADFDWPLTPKIDRPEHQGGQRQVQGRRRYEYELFSEFRRQANALKSTPVEDEWTWLAVAQHHGLATRLLDWSEQMLVALYFVVEDVLLTNFDVVRDGALFVVSPRFADSSSLGLQGPFDVEEVALFRPPARSPRIVAQRAVFTVHPEGSALGSGTIKKIRIPRESKWALLLELRSLGIDRRTLFPDLDGLATEINWEFGQHASERGAC